MYVLFCSAVPQLPLYIGLCCNYFCTCGFAAQKHIFAALPQNEDRKHTF
jgi:hypothetical protein